MKRKGNRVVCCRYKRIYNCNFQLLCVKSTNSSFGNKFRMQILNLDLKSTSNIKRESFERIFKQKFEIHKNEGKRNLVKNKYEKNRNNEIKHKILSSSWEGDKSERKFRCGLVEHEGKSQIEKGIEFISRYIENIYCLLIFVNNQQSEQARTASAF